MRLLRAAAWPLSHWRRARGRTVARPAVVASPARPAARPGDAATRFPREARERLPRPPDVWSLVREVPGVVVDRVNVGGSETGAAVDRWSRAATTARVPSSRSTAWTSPTPRRWAPSPSSPTSTSRATCRCGRGRRTCGCARPGAHVDAALPRPRPTASAAPRTRAAGSTRCSRTTCRTRSRAARSSATARTGCSELGASAGGGLSRRRRGCGAASRGTRCARRRSPSTRRRSRVTTFAAKARLATRSHGPVAARAAQREGARGPRHGPDDVAGGALAAVRARTTCSSVEGAADVRQASTRLARVSYLDGGFRLDGGGRARRRTCSRTSAASCAARTTRSAATGPRLQATVGGARDARARSGSTTSWLAGAGYRRSDVHTTPRSGPATRCWRSSGRASSSARSASPASRCPTATRTAAPSTTAPRSTRRTSCSRGRLDRLARRAPRPPVRPEPAPRRSRRTRSSPSSCRRSRSPAAAPASPGRTCCRARASRTSLDRGTSVRLRASYAAYGPWLGAGDVTFDNPIGREAASRHVLLARPQRRPRRAGGRARPA